MSTTHVICALLVLVVCIFSLRIWTTNTRRPPFDIFLINLKQSDDRRTNFERFHHQMVHKVPYHHVQAVDANVMKHTTMFQTWPSLRNTYHGTKALQLSNIKCLKRAIALRSEWAIICEDDAELPKTVSFRQVVKKYPNSKVIYMDNRNQGGDGVVPGCCTNCVMYHKSVFADLVRHLDPRSPLYIEFASKCEAPMFDFYLSWLLRRLSIHTSSHPLIGGHRFDTTLDYPSGKKN